MDSTDKSNLLAGLIAIASICAVVVVLAVEVLR
jgi:hypothetical protein